MREQFISKVSGSLRPLFLSDDSDQTIYSGSKSVQEPAQGIREFHRVQSPLAVSHLNEAITALLEFIHHALRLSGFVSHDHSPPSGLTAKYSRRPITLLSRNLLT